MQKGIQGLKATMLMIVAEMAMAGINIFYKIAATDGMRMTILITYRYLFATIFILPFAFFIERERDGELGNVKGMQGLRATIFMTATVIVMAGINIFYKIAAVDGMRMTILITYRYLFATILILPFAFFIERYKRPKLSRTILFQTFLTAFLGGPLAQNLQAQSLLLTSATFSTTFANLLPPLTFVFSVLFRLEKIEIGTKAGKAKVTGTIVGVGGAMILTLYKGHQLNIPIPSTHFNILHAGQPHLPTTHNTSAHHIIGSLLAIIANISLAIALIFQSKTSALYPCHYSTSFLISSMGFIQSYVFAICTERSWSEWKLGWNVRQLASLYSGIGSILAYIFVMETLCLRGPLFVSNFFSLMLVFVAIAGLFVLDEKLHVGSVIGAVIIIVGLYLVLWGKSNTKKLSNEIPLTILKGVETSLSTTNEDGKWLPTTTREKDKE